MIKDWFKISRLTDDLQQLVKVILNSKRSKFRKQVLFAGLTTLIYFISKFWNSVYWDHYIPNIDHVVKQLKLDTRARILVVIPKNV